MINEHHLRVQRTARYYTLGELNAQTTDLWFVLHGYGQLAKYFIRRFDVVQNEKTVVVAPEGLSRLYLDSEYGKIGASWITREDRDNEVQDYIAYLNQLYDTVMAGRTADSAIRCVSPCLVSRRGRPLFAAGLMRDILRLINLCCGRGSFLMASPTLLTRPNLPRWDQIHLRSAR